MDWMNAGLSLGRWFGIRVVMSWLFLIWAGMQILQAGKAWTYEAMSMGVLFGLVLLHEFGHCFACRSVKGYADRILLWPLGGLAYCSSPDRPWPQFVTTVGGPLVNVVLVPVTAGLLVGLAYVPMPERSWEVTHTVLESVFRFNLMLLLFNVIPAYPMDGGRMLQEIMWPIIGYPRSLIVAGMVGTAAGVAFVGLGLGLHTFSIPLPLGLDPFTLAVQGHRNWFLAAIGVMCVMQSFGIYQRGTELARYRRG